MYNTCCFINLEKFEVNEDLEMKIYCTILKEIKNNCIEFIFQRNQFNDFCYRIVTNFQSCFFNLQRTCVAEATDHVCVKNQKLHIEELIKNLTGQIIPLYPYEKIINFSHLQKIEKQSKENFILGLSSICIVYSKEDNVYLERLKNFTETKNIKLIVIN